MNITKRIRRVITLFFCIFTLVPTWGQSAFVPDSVEKKSFIHKVGVEFRADRIVPTNPFVDGKNKAGKQISTSLSAHLRYGFQSRPNSLSDRIFGGVYQGIGFAAYEFGNREELGSPMALFLFQGARIAQITPRLSFNYEWNFGVSWGWEPYNTVENKLNIMMGSKINAYINTDFFLHWMVSRRIDLQTGLTLTHFSNGNTKIPNAGMNSIGWKLGMMYNFGRGREFPVGVNRRSDYPYFQRHMSYDVMVFGSFCRQGVEINNLQVASPHSYPVTGLNFAPMYNFNYKFRAGISLDAVYDSSANVYSNGELKYDENHNGSYVFHSPGIDKQLALGISARGEYVMPYFTIGIGLGVNVWHKGGDLKAFYQILALKIAVTRSSYINVGYNLKNLHEPNYLMIGVGYRFNNKYPRIR